MNDKLIHLWRFHPRLLIALVVAAAAAGLMPGQLSGITRALIGWNAGAWSYLAMIWLMMIRSPKGKVRGNAEKEDQSAVLVLTLVSLSAVASLVAIVHELANAKAGVSHQAGAHVLFATITLIGGWLLVPTIFTQHYARLYFTDAEHPHALTFPDRECDPDYWDFLYFTFTIAVASQTADIGLASRRMRRAALAQSVMSFFFNLAVLGLSINIGASLLS